ncbi:MAG: Bacillopeptidase F [Calditrichaeota bacterium]|nr:Bacillopeptidase F [Calditrichota bacterium]
MRHRIGVALSLLLAAGAPAQIIEETGSLRGFLTGSEPAAACDNWISHTVEAIAAPGYNEYAPDWIDPQSEGFGEYRFIPGTWQGDETLQRWRDVFDALFAAQYETAADLLADSSETFRYEFVHFTDTETGREFYVIREQLDEQFIDDFGTPDPEDDVIGSFRNGWGVFVYNPDASRSETMLQAPHVNDDYISMYVAVELLFRLDAAALVADGTGREVAWTGIGDYANDKSLSDPTRYARMPFVTYCEAFADHVTGEYPQIPVNWQIHSFDSSHTLYPIVLSCGYQQSDPHMPFRDESHEGADVFSNTPPTVFDAGEWIAESGPLPELPVEQYYMIHSADPVYVYYGEQDTVQISPAPALWGSINNHPGSYVQQPDRYAQGQALEPFLHIELHEFPLYFNNNDVPLEYLFNLDVFPPEYGTFAPYLAFYEPFIAAIEGWYGWFDTLDGGAPPPAPEFLTAISDGNGGLITSWDGPEDGKLLTFEVLADTVEPAPDSPVVWTADDDINLRRVGFDGSTTIESLADDQSYQLAVRMRDLAGVTGPLSPAFPVFNFDSQGVHIEFDQFETFPLSAWPLWLCCIPLEEDIGSLTAVWRLDGGDPDTLTLAPEGELGAWAKPLPENLPIADGSLIEWRFHTTDLSADGNPLAFPSEDEWYSATLAHTSSRLTPISFERDSEQFSFQGDWEIGVPSSGPDSARDGRQVLATRLDGPYTYQATCTFRVLDYIRPEYGPLALVWWHWLDYPLLDDYPGLAEDGGRIRTSMVPFPLVEPAGGYPYRTADGKDVFAGTSEEWTPVVVDLRPSYGPPAALRFSSETSGETGHDGWYIDEVQLVRWIDEHPPQPFELNEPDHRAELTGEPVRFAWEECVDPDPHAWPAYRLHIEAGRERFVFRAGGGTRFTLDLARLPEHAFERQELTWWVEAISQDDTLASSERRTLLLSPSFAVKPKATPERFALNAAYPNPFNASVTLSYSLPRASRVRLVVYDVLGRQVATLETRQRPAGEHAVTWDAGGHASGVYFAVLAAGDFRAAKKLLLMK